MSDWHTSSYSGGTNECVEVREQDDSVDIRDTQHREMGHLSFPTEAWTAFLEDVKSGRL